MYRKSGEPYILHPLEVSKIVSRDIGLGAKSITCALLHDVVEDTDYTLEDISRLFGEKIASIIDGLTKISDVLITNRPCRPKILENATYPFRRCKGDTH